MTEVIDTPESVAPDAGHVIQKADTSGGHPSPRVPPSIRRGTFGRLMLWVAGTLVSIYIGTIFQTWWTEKKPLYTQGATVVLATSQGAPSRLQFRWDGESIENACVTSVALWNGGRAFIDASDLTESDPLRIVPSTTVRILEARIVALSRPKLPVALTVEQDEELGRQVILVSLARDAWEHEDGFHVSIFYAGPADTRFTVAGRVKGTSGFDRYVPGKRFDPDNFDPSDWRNIEWRREAFRVAVFAGCCLIAAIVFMVMQFTWRMCRRIFTITRNTAFGFDLDSILVAVGLLVFAVSAYLADTRLVLWFDTLILPPSWIRL